MKFARWPTKATPGRWSKALAASTAWVVTRAEETSTHFFRDGAAEKIEFNLTLEHVDDERTDLIGRLALPAVARLAGGYV